MNIAKKPLTNESIESFFIVLPLNLEKLGLKELELKWPIYFSEFKFPTFQIHDGGIEIQVPTSIGFLLNFILKTPTRILLRISDFQCRDFPKLYQKMSKFDWAGLLIGQLPPVEISVKNSRMFDSRKIESAVHDGIKTFYKKKPVRKNYSELLKNPSILPCLPKLYFRIIDDHVVMSIDTSGERLHLRHEKQLTGFAPIRESLATLLLLELFSQNSQNSFDNLLDPMCGSGTFLIEAMQFHKLNNNREFAFQFFPLVLKDRLLYNLKEANAPRICNNGKGYDISNEVVLQAKQNALQISQLEFSQSDLLNQDLNHDQSKVFQTDCVIVNPPYGKRIGSQIEINSEFFILVMASIQKKYNPKILGIIIPQDFEKNHYPYETLSRTRFENGGFPVVFYCFKLR